MSGVGLVHFECICRCNAVASKTQTSLNGYPRVSNLEIRIRIGDRKVRSIKSHHRRNISGEVESRGEYWSLKSARLAFSVAKVVSPTASVIEARTIVVVRQCASRYHQAATEVERDLETWWWSRQLGDINEPLQETSLRAWRLSVTCTPRSSICAVAFDRLPPVLR